MAEKTIEQKVADAVLQKDTEVTIGNKRYKVAPPSIATLILVSEAISLLPTIKLEEQNLAEEVLSQARYCRPLGDIMAVFILGAKGITRAEKTPQTAEKKYLWGLFKRRYITYTDVVVDCKAELSKEILETLTPLEMQKMVATMLSSLQLGDFFAVTTFLTGVNLLHPTKVGNETTVFGQ